MIEAIRSGDRGGRHGYIANISLVHVDDDSFTTREIETSDTNQLIEVIIAKSH